jgi:Zn-dependent protease with chaperone function
VRKYQEYQEGAHQLTAGLCLLLAVAVVGTIVFSSLALAGVAVGSTWAYLAATVNMEWPAEHWYEMYTRRLIDASVFTTLIVIGMAIYKTLQWAEGGGRAVARHVGGERVLAGSEDPGHRKLLNVVEELAIATGLRAPPVYVMEGEPGINAFAAGFHPKEAVIGVTRGAIDRLTRQQLQGVVAHEFSHIAHGDMRLNIRLMGVLAGIQAITSIARYLIRLGVTVRSKGGTLGPGKHPLGMMLALVFGLAIWPVGAIGSAFALVIKLAVNRQREYLADASAVQYTRDPIALCEALQVIAEDEVGSEVRGPSAHIASHMYFAEGGGMWMRLLQTHPPLAERIRRLDPAGSFEAASRNGSARSVTSIA